MHRDLTERLKVSMWADSYGRIRFLYLSSPASSVPLFWLDPVISAFQACSQLLYYFLGSAINLASPSLHCLPLSLCRTVTQFLVSDVLVCKLAVSQRLIPCQAFGGKERIYGIPRNFITGNNYNTQVRLAELGSPCSLID